MSHVEAQQSGETSPISPSNDAKAAIEAKRDLLERVANTDYPAAEHAKTLLDIIDSSN